jgi:glutathione S-transferase
MSMIFYYGSGSPYAWKVWLSLEHKGIDYTFKRLQFDNGDTKTPEFLAVNPRGKVPAIMDDGFALWESTPIVEYLEERYPQKPLLPKDVKGRARIRRIMAAADNYLQPPIGDLAEELLYKSDGGDAAAIAKAKEGIFAELARFDAALPGDYFHGDDLTLADFTVFPYMRMLWRIEERKPGQGVGGDIPERLVAWMKRIEALPYYARTIPPHWKG